MQDRNSGSSIDGRRRFIRTGLGVAGGLALPAGLRIAAPSPPTSRRSAPGRPARPGNSVFIGIAVPRTGTYAVQGEDELKG